MSFLSSVGEFCAVAVGKVAEVASGGALGRVISDALAKLGLPPTICNLMASMVDPGCSTKKLCEEIDRAGKALGLPQELTGALKKMAQKAEHYSKAFAEGGLGAVVCAMGKDLGLPPALYQAVAAAVDAYTGNAAGAAAHLTQLSAECAKFLGVPAGVLQLTELATRAYARDLDGVIDSGLKIGLDVVDQIDVAPEYKSLLHLGASIYRDDAQAIPADALALAGNLAQRLGAPPEVMGLVQLVVAYETGNEPLAKLAGKQVAAALIDRLPLPPLLALGLQRAARAGIDNADEVKAVLARLPEMIEQLPGQARASARAVWDFLIQLGQPRQPDPQNPGLLAAVRTLIERAQQQLTPEDRSILQLSLDVARGGTAALSQQRRLELRG